MRTRMCVLFAMLLAPCLPLRAGDFLTAGHIASDRNGDRWARRTLKKLSLEEKIGQMFMVRVLTRFMNRDDPAFIALRGQISRYHVGSVLLTVPAEGPFLDRSEPYEAAMLANQLQRESRLPLLVAADFERGPSMRLRGVTEFPHAMAFGAAGSPELTEEFGRITARESRALGVEWNFFPVAAVDRTRDQMEQIDLLPFRGAIAAGVDGVMVAHVTATALEPDAERVATTSPRIVTDVLKKELGFHGLVVTDALEMGGLVRLYPQGGAAAAGRAAVDAVRAGNDLLILPSSLEGAYDGVLRAVRSGEISESRIDESVLKILKAKASAGLDRARLVDINAVSSIVASPASLAFAARAAAASITLVRENGRVLPLKNHGTAAGPAAYGSSEHQGSSVVCVVLTDDVRTENGRMMERELRARIRDVSIFYVDPRIASGMAPMVEQAVASAGRVIVAVYMVPVAGKTVASNNGGAGNSIALTQTPGALLQSILASAHEKTVVMAMGSPYIAADFPMIENYLCAYSNVPISESAAVKALFAEIPLRGRLPVTIPGFAARGTGIEKPAAR